MAERKVPSAADLVVLDPDGAFVRRLRNDRDALTRLAAGLWATPTNARRARLAEIAALAHRLAGAAGTFGYPAVGSAALELEDRVIAGSDGLEDCSTEDCSTIEDGLAGLRAALEDSLGTA